MGLSSALATAMTGLRANQAALSIISGNVANAQTPGYVTQKPNQIEVNSGGDGSTVLTTGVSRQLDLFVQNQLRTETSGGAYADQTANILGQLQSVYGTPGGDGTLETTLNNFTTALQALSSNPGNQSAQAVALSAAQTLAQQLNTTTRGIQSLRSNVEQDIGNSATQANAAMTQIAQINTQLQGLSPTDPEAATLMDQRDNALSQLAKLVDVRAVTDSSNQTNVFTTSGIQLVGAGLASGQHCQPDLHRHRDQHPAPDLDRQRERSGRAAAAQCGQREPKASRRRFLRRRGLGRCAIEYSAWRQPPAILECCGLAAGGRRRDKFCNRQCGFGHDDRYVACQWKSPASVVHRRKFDLCRPDHRERLGADGPCRTHHGERGAARR